MIASVRETPYCILLKNLAYKSKILPKSCILPYCVLNIFLTALTGEYFLHLLKFVFCVYSHSCSALPWAVVVFP